MKLVVCQRTRRVLGAHMLGEDAPEIMQGVGIAVAMGATKEDFDRTVGIHPTAAEEFVTLRTRTRERACARRRNDRPRGLHLHGGTDHGLSCPIHGRNAEHGVARVAPRVAGGTCRSGRCPTTRTRPAWRGGERLAAWPPLVFAGEARRLQAALAAAGEGKAFVLQGGDCAESFSDFTANIIRDTFRVLLQMAVVLTFGGGLPVVKLGAWRGSSPSRAPPTRDARRRGSALLPRRHRQRPRVHARGAHRGPVADGVRLHAVGGHAEPAAGLRHGRLRRPAPGPPLEPRLRGAQPARLALRRLGAPHRRDARLHAACGMSDLPQVRETEFYTSHEALLLPYEQALTRVDSTTGDSYACSAHFLWIGDRTRQPDGAHVEFLRGVRNPIGLKVGPSTDAGELVRLTEILNPANAGGRLTLISRMGPGRWRRSCRRCCAPSIAPAATSPGSAIPCTATPQRSAPTRPAASTPC
jgi:hypothetical protein